LSVAKNPFKVLGLDPAILKGLSDPQILRISEAMYRALVSIHHHDVGGKGSVSRDLNEAIYQIRNKDLFLHWKTEHLRPRKEQVLDLEEQLDQERTKHNEMVRGLLNTIIDYALEFSGAILEKGPRRILISNVLKGKLQAYSSAIPNKEKGEVFELTINGKGELLRKTVKKVGFDARTQQAPCLPKGWVCKSGVPWNAYYWNPAGACQKITDINLIGSIATEEIQRSGEIGAFNQLIRSSDSGIDEQDIVEIATGFPLLDFLHYVPLIDPMIECGRYLIGFSGTCAQDGRCIVMGKIIAIHSGT